MSIVNKNLYCIPIYNPYYSLPFPSQAEINELIDSILNDLEEGQRGAIYHFDQMIYPLCEYLKSHPEKTDLVRQLVEEKKIYFGPFFIQLHSGHISGELLIRNLLIGHQEGDKIGDILKYFHLPAMRGRNSQTPQILSGFNIDAVLIDYDIKLMDKNTTEFIWEGLDGTQLLVSRVVFLNPNRLNLAKSKIQETFREYFSHNPNRVLVYLFNDKKSWETMPTYIEKLASIFSSDLKIESLADCIWEIKEQIDSREISEYKGEMCLEKTDDCTETQFDYYLRHSIAIGLSNHRLENLIQYVVEPWSLIMKYLQPESKPKSTNHIWEEFLKNQTFTYLVDTNPNKFIQSLSTTQTGQMNRLEEQVKDLITAVVNNIHIDDSNPNNIYFTVFNSLPYNRSEIVEFVVEMPSLINRDTIVAKEVGGREISFRVLHKETETLFKYDKADKAKYRCLVELRDLPGMGWKTFEIDLNGRPKSYPAVPISAERNSLENDFLRVEINQNGTLEIFAKETGEFFSEVAYFQDEIDLGRFSVEDKTATHIPLTTKKLHPQIKLLYNSPKAAAYKIEYFWEIPEMFNWKNSRRSPRHETIKISEIVTLSSLSRMIDLKIEINDHAYDHMIKICFPVEFVPENTYTDGFFSVETRPLNGLQYLHCQALSMGNFVGVSNESGGFAIFSDGINEYQLLKGKHNVLTLTLVRDFPIVRSKKTGGTILSRNEKTEVHLSIYPRLSDWTSSDILTEAIIFNNPIIIRQMDQTNGYLPAKMQFLKVTPDTLFYSALKPTEDEKDVVLRLYNPTRNIIVGEIATYFPIKAARYLTVEEHIIAPLEISDPYRLKVKVFPQKIMTLKIIFDRLPINSSGS
ncbi:MAG TPA: glycoside hydrolase family 38 C-terminal domain-containing protein [Candidatus Marinimicrobia bacterium]|mgnify:FL=1|jgi:alpha-mannosidase|nr:glycoside hydrolase family 38 C-terminal domain-containing protein [Candidatus Neomarinimicrobiota bacterium]